MSQFSKNSIDRLGKRLRDSDTPDPADVATYVDWSATLEQPMKVALDTVNEASERTGVPLDEKTSRIKQLYSIVAKLRLGHPRLSSIDDIAGCRAVVERETDVNALVLQLATANVKRVRDYRRRDRNGYRAVQLALVDDAGTSRRAATSNCNPARLIWIVGRHDQSGGPRGTTCIASPDRRTHLDLQLLC